MAKQIKAIHLIKPKDLKESFDSPFSSVTENSVDEGNFRISNVCLFGRRESANGRIYLDKAIESIASLANGTKCFINHCTKTEMKERSGVRDLRDWVGVFEGSRKDGEKVFANLKVRESYWDLVKDIALMQPMGIGHSIDARVKVFVDEKTGLESVADVAHLRSVDLVSSAATTQNLFESALKDREDNEDETFELYKVATENTVRQKFIYYMTEEGIIQDKIDNEKLRSEIYRVVSYANDLIYDVIYSDKLSIKEKKDKVITIFDDLDNEVKKRLDVIKESIKEDDTLGKEFTFEDVKQNKEIMEALLAEIKEAEEYKAIKTQVAALQESNTALTKQVEEGKKQLEEKDKEVAELKESVSKLESEKKELAGKVDAFEVDKKIAEKKSMIQSLIAEAKLPQEAVTDIFMEDLMSLQDKKDGDKTVTVKEQAQKRIEERVKLVSKKGVVNSGEEFTRAMESKTENVPKKSITEATDDFASKIAR